MLVVTSLLGIRHQTISAEGKAHQLRPNMCTLISRPGEVTYLGLNRQGCIPKSKSLPCLPEFGRDPCPLVTPRLPISR
jgi:hypothetical protein